MSKKITKEEFFEMLEQKKAQSDRLDKLSEAGIDIWDSDLIEFGNIMFEKAIEAMFTEEGSEWIFWWLYEKDGDPEMKAFDEDNDEIPTETMMDLWRLVKKYRR